MAHFAELDENDVVLRVIVVDNGELIHPETGKETEILGKAFCVRYFQGVDWVQTSYNGNLRKNYASVGYTYNRELDAFVPPKPLESWVLDEEIARWIPPIAKPDPPEDFSYEWYWNEETTNWSKRYPPTE